MSATITAEEVRQPLTERHQNIGGKFLTFFLGEEEYGIEILRVNEIIGMMTITPIPRTSHYVRGVINLRGKVIPVIDLRLKLDMPPHEQTSETCIIVVQVRGAQMGIVVDKVSEVLDIATDQVEDVPSMGSDVRVDYLLGIGRTEDRVRLLLNIDRVMSDQEVDQLSSAAGAMAE
jgi:purine-binding chemotaxis protein CheW